MKRAAHEWARALVAGALVATCACDQGAVPVRTDASHAPSSAPVGPPAANLLRPHVLAPDGEAIRTDVVVRVVVAQDCSEGDKLKPCAHIEIENAGNTSIDLAGALVVQRRLGEKWLFTLGKNGTGQCGTPSWNVCRTLHPRERLTPSPWMGWTCASQCIPSCRSNSPEEDGEYRVVLRTCDEKTTFVGVPFAWKAAR